MCLFNIYIIVMVTSKQYMSLFWKEQKIHKMTIGIHSWIAHDIVLTLHGGWIFLLWLFCWILVRAFVCWGRVFVGNKPRQWTGCTNSPPTYIMHSSPKTFCGFHPSYSNSNKFRPAMACNSCLPHHRRFRMRSEYSVRIGMGMTHTCSWNPTLVLQHDNDDDDESLLLLCWSLYLSGTWNKGGAGRGCRCCWHDDDDDVQVGGAEVLLSALLLRFVTIGSSSWIPSLRNNRERISCPEACFGACDGWE